MIISELIKKLNAEKKLHGDIEVQASFSDYQDNVRDISYKHDERYPTLDYLLLTGAY